MLRAAFLFLIIAVNFSALAQERKLNVTSQNLIFKKQGYTFFKPTFVIPASNYIPVFESPVHYTALFCRMEKVIYKQLNVWVKMRAGSDADYRNLCGGNRGLQ